MARKKHSRSRERQKANEILRRLRDELSEEERAEAIRREVSWKTAAGIIVPGLSENIIDKLNRATALAKRQMERPLLPAPSQETYASLQRSWPQYVQSFRSRFPSLPANVPSTLIEQERQKYIEAGIIEEPIPWIGGIAPWTAPPQETMPKARRLSHPGHKPIYGMPPAYTPPLRRPQYARLDYFPHVQSFRQQYGIGNLDPSALLKTIPGATETETIKIGYEQRPIKAAKIVHKQGTFYAAPFSSGQIMLFGENTQSGIAVTAYAEKGESGEPILKGPAKVLEEVFAGEKPIRSLQRMGFSYVQTQEILDNPLRSRYIGSGIKLGYGRYEAASAVEQLNQQLRKQFPGIAKEDLLALDKLGSTAFFASQVFNLAEPMAKAKRLSSAVRIYGRGVWPGHLTPPVYTSPYSFEGKVPGRFGQAVPAIFDVFAPDIAEGQAFSRNIYGARPMVFRLSAEAAERLGYTDQEGTRHVQNVIYGSRGLASKFGAPQAGELVDFEEIVGKPLRSYRGFHIESLTKNEDDTFTLTGLALTPHAVIKEGDIKVNLLNVGKGSIDSGYRIRGEASSEAIIRTLAASAFKANFYTPDRVDLQWLTWLQEKLQAGKITQQQYDQMNYAVEQGMVSKEYADDFRQMQLDWFLRESGYRQLTHRQNVEISQIAYEAILKAGIPTFTDPQGTRIPAFDPSAVKIKDGRVIIPSLYTESFAGLYNFGFTPEFGKRQFLLSPDTLRLMQNFTPDIYQALAQNYRPNIGARQILQARMAMAEDVQQDVRKAIASEYGIHQLDRSRLEQIAFGMGGADTGGADYQRELLLRYMRGLPAEERGKMIDYEGVLFPNLRTIMSALTSSKTGASVRNFASAAVSLMLASPQEEDFEAKKGNYMRFLDMMASSRRIFNRAMGLEVYGAPINIGYSVPLNANEIMVSAAQAQRMLAKTEQYKDITLEQVLEMAQKGTLPTTAVIRYPQANPNLIAKAKMRIYELESDEFREKFANPGEKIMVSEAIAQMMSGDFDVDRYFGAVLPGIQPDSPETIASLGRNIPNSEFAKQVERFSGIRDTLRAIRTGVFSPLKGPRELAKEYIQNEINRRKTGVLYNVFHRMLAPGEIRMAERAGVSTAGREFLKAGIGKITAFAQQKAVDLSESSPEALDIAHILQFTNWGTRKNPNQFAGATPSLLGTGEVGTYEAAWGVNAVGFMGRMMGKMLALGSHEFRQTIATDSPDEQIIAEYRDLIPGIVSQLMPREKLGDANERARLAGIVEAFARGKIDESQALSAFYGSDLREYLFGADPMRRSSFGDLVIGAMNARGARGYALGVDEPGIDWKSRPGMEMPARTMQEVAAENQVFKNLGRGVLKRATRELHRFANTPIGKALTDLLGIQDISKLKESLSVKSMPLPEGVIGASSLNLFADTELQQAERIAASLVGGMRGGSATEKRHYISEKINAILGNTFSPQVRAAMQRGTSMHKKIQEIIKSALGDAVEIEKRVVAGPIGTPADVLFAPGSGIDILDIKTSRDIDINKMVKRYLPQMAAMSFSDAREGQRVGVTLMPITTGDLTSEQIEALSPDQIKAMLAQQAETIEAHYKSLLENPTYQEIARESLQQMEIYKQRVGHAAPLLAMPAEKMEAYWKSFLGNTNLQSYLQKVAGAVISGKPLEEIAQIIRSLSTQHFATRADLPKMPVVQETFSPKEIPKSAEPPRISAIPTLGNAGGGDQPPEPPSTVAVAAPPPDPEDNRSKGDGVSKQPDVIKPPPPVTLGGKKKLPKSDKVLSALQFLYTMNPASGEPGLALGTPRGEAFKLGSTVDDMARSIDGLIDSFANLKSVTKEQANILNSIVQNAPEFKEVLTQIEDYMDSMGIAPSELDRPYQEILKHKSIIQALSSQTIQDLLYGDNGASEQLMRLRLSGITPLNANQRNPMRALFGSGIEAQRARERLFGRGGLFENWDPLGIAEGTDDPRALAMARLSRGIIGWGGRTGMRAINSLWRIRMLGATLNAPIMGMMHDYMQEQTQFDEMMLGTGVLNVQDFMSGLAGDRLRRAIGMNALRRGIGEQVYAAQSGLINALSGAFVNRSAGEGILGSLIGYGGPSLTLGASAGLILGPAAGIIAGVGSFGLHTLGGVANALSTKQSAAMTYGLRDYSLGGIIAHLGMRAFEGLNINSSYFEDIRRLNRDYEQYRSGQRTFWERGPGSEMLYPAIQEAAREWESKYQVTSGAIQSLIGMRMPYAATVPDIERFVQLYAQNRNVPLEPFQQLLSAYSVNRNINPLTNYEQYGALQEELLRTVGGSFNPLMEIQRQVEFGSQIQNLNFYQRLAGVPVTPIESVASMPDSFLRQVSILAQEENTRMLAENPGLVRGAFGTVFNQITNRYNAGEISPGQFMYARGRIRNMAPIFNAFQVRGMDIAPWMNRYAETLTADPLRALQIERAIGGDMDLLGQYGTALNAMIPSGLNVDFSLFERNPLTGLTNIQIREREFDERQRALAREQRLFGLNIQERQFNRQMAYTTGGGALTAGGWVVGGQPSVWSIQDAQERLQREQQQWRLQQSTQGIGMQQRQMALGIQQFYENWNANWAQFQYSTNFQRQQMQIGRQRDLQQRTWAREDMAFSENIADLQFGWQMEDFDRNIRYARGRQRLDMMRQRDRAVTMYALQETQRDRSKARFETQAQWSDEDFERQKSHFEEITRFREEDLLRQKRHFEERQRLEQESFELSKSNHEKEMEWLKRSWALEDQQRQLTREHWLWIQGLEKEQLDFAKTMEEKSKALNDEIVNFKKTIENTVDYMKTVDFLALVTGMFGISGVASTQGVPAGTPPSVPAPKPVSTPKPSGSGKIKPVAFASGGFTGYGSGREVAGYVHTNEYVVPEGGALVVRGSDGSIPYLERMIQLLERIVEMGPGRVNATIYTNDTQVKTGDLYTRALGTIN